VLADRSTPLILKALARAAAEPDGISLFAGKNLPGLFGSSAAAKQAAQRCKADGFLRTALTETRGKTVHELCALTEKGLTYLLTHAGPKQVFEDFIRALDARREQLSSVLEGVRNTQHSLESMRSVVETLAAISAEPVGPAPSTNGRHDRFNEIVAHLTSWRDSGASGDCPLPDLYRRTLQSGPLTIGQFHDVLRKLHEQERIYLHPWTGPLYDLPEPSSALLVGHVIAYYAGIREPAGV
jgi:hypothetical protein